LYRSALRAAGLAVLLVALATATRATAATAPDRVILLLPEGTAPLGTGPLGGGAPVTGSPALDRLAREVGGTAIEPYYPGVLRRPALARLADRLRVLRLAPGADAAAAAERLAAVPDLAAAEVPQAPRLLYTPDDPLYPQQWFLPHVGAPPAWDVVRDPATRSVAVALVDTGLDLDEPDLAPSLWVNAAEDLDGDGRLSPADLDGIDQDRNGFPDDVVGWDFAGDDPDPQETHAHGSGVGACIGAATDNGLGLSSLGFGLRIMVLRAIGDGGVLVDGYLPMLYAADNGAGVINCSWGVPIAQAYEQAIVDAVGAEDVVIVAAGGEGPQIVYPAGYDGVVGVSATDAADHRASFAPYGPSVDLCAPGVNILTIWDGTPAIVSGTSFASGLVAALVGLVRAADPAASAPDVVEILASTAVDIDALNPGFEGQLGAGRIDAFAAVGAAAVGVPVDAARAGAALRLRCEPNPARDGTTVRYELPRPGPVEIAVFDVGGRRVATIAAGPRGAGPHAERWNAHGLAAGVYLVRTTGGGASAVRSVTLLR
jgi:hypothetical protein